MVSIGNNHGYLNDCDTTTGFTKTDNGNTSTFTIDSGDYFKLDVTVSGTPFETKVVNDANIAKSTTLFPTIRWRYKCSNSSIKAKIIAEFSDASTQNILVDSNSTTFTVGSTTLTTAKTLDHIQLYADHAVGTVFYDFILVYEGQFPLPNVAGGMDLDPVSGNVSLGIPGRITDVTQDLGNKNAVVNCSCDLDQGTWKRTTPTADTIDGEVFLDIAHNSRDEPWQWLDTGSHQFKVTVDSKFRWVNNGDGSTSRLLDLVFTEYSLGDKSGETYAERFGIGL